MFPRWLLKADVECQLSTHSLPQVVPEDRQYRALSFGTFLEVLLEPEKRVIIVVHNVVSFFFKINVFM